MSEEKKKKTGFFNRKNKNEIKINYDVLSFSCNPNTQISKVCKRPRKWKWIRNFPCMICFDLEID